MSTKTLTAFRGDDGAVLGQIRGQEKNRLTVFRVEPVSADRAPTTEAAPPSADVGLPAHHNQLLQMIRQLEAQGVAGRPMLERIAAEERARPMPRGVIVRHLTAAGVWIE